MTNLTKADVVAPDAVRSADIVPQSNKRKPNMKTKLSARAALIGSPSLSLTACSIPPETASMEISMGTIRSADYGTYPNDYGWCPKMYADKRRANKKQRRHGIFEVWKLKIPFAVPVAVGRI